MEKFNKHIGKVFDGRYRIERIVGMGGMSVVFEAWDLLMKRKVAVKLLRDEINNDAQSVKRFINESKAVAMLSHPNIVNIYDVSVKEALKFIVMEYIEGITLKSYMVKKGVLSFKELISYTEQILRALEHAHAKGVIHRDIKPQNIMLLKNGLIKVTDFGIAKLPNAETVTMTDKAIGTVYYISPEQASGKKIDARSDIYSLGVLLYEMATGRLPFTADSPVSVALMQINNTAQKPREINPKIPQGLEQIILSAIEKDPERRFQSASQMLKQIAKLRQNPDAVFKPITNSKTGKGKRTNQLTTMLPIILGVSTAFLGVLIVSGIWVISHFLNETANDPIDIDIPNFIGKTYTETFEEEQETEGDYFRIRVKYVYNGDSEPNTIVDQEPRAGEKRRVINGRQFADVTLYVSMGAQTTIMADYTVREKREAELLLREQGFGVVFETVHHDTILEGYVVTTDPKPGEPVTTGDTVKVYISLGEEIQTTIVPNFIDMHEIDAYRALVQSKLGIGKITYRQSNKAKGTILSQSITPFESVPVRVTKIDFVISSGPEDTTDETTDDTT
ncbi:MAG: protein kinase [Clostridiales bacterium]|nr:protein kinase [Clostridiales bacterium]